MSESEQEITTGPSISERQQLTEILQQHQRQGAAVVSEEHDPVRVARENLRERDEFQWVRTALAELDEEGHEWVGVPKIAERAGVDAWLAGRVLAIMNEDGEIERWSPNSPKKYHIGGFDG